MTYKLNKHRTNGTSQPKRLGVIKLAQDVHAHFVVFSIQEEGQQPKAPRKMLMEPYLLWVEQLATRAQKIYSCYEAGPTGFALHRKLTALGIENIVIVPSRLDENGKKVNTDRTDTLALASRLDRYVAGNKLVFTVVKVPSPEQEQRRCIPRQKNQLQAQRLSLASQGRSLVLTQGRAITNNWWRPKQWELFQKILPTWLIERLHVFRALILAIDEQIQKLNENIEIRRAAQPQPQPKYAGTSTMETLDTEVGDWDRFSSWRKAGSYVGLTGGVSASGMQHSDLSITKVGNRRLRSALIELAWRVVRYQPDYWLTKKWGAILGKDSKAHRRLRKKAIVAFGRQLFVDLWKWKTGRTTAEKLGWIMV